MLETQRAVVFTGEEGSFHRSDGRQERRREGTDVTWRCQRKHRPQRKAVEREFLLTLLCSGAKLPLIECHLAALPAACQGKLLL